MLLIQSLVIFLGVATATNFQAWNGNTCNGDAGSKVLVFASGSCEDVTGRHSWEADGDDVRGYYYTGSGCQGASHAFTGKNGKCNNINTGGTVKSMCVVGHANSGCGY